MSWSLEKFKAKPKKKLSHAESLDLANIRETLIERSRKRVVVGFGITAGDISATVEGSRKLGDKFDSYEVSIKHDRSSHHCSCQDHMGGEFRSKICSHVVAVLLEHERFIAEARESRIEGVKMEAINAPQAPPYTPAEWAERTTPTFTNSIPDEWRPHLSMPTWFSGFRPWQVEAIRDILKAWSNGFDIVFLEAPTGAGKTAISEGARQIWGGLHLGKEARGCYVCTTKPLQDQFCHDMPYARLIKGKANYPTASHPESFDLPNSQDSISCGDCTYNPTDGCQWCARETDLEPRQAALRCPYKVARMRAARGELAVLNTSYFMQVAKFLPPDEVAPSFVGREVVTLDEADMLEQQLMGAVEVTVSRRALDRMGVGMPEKKTVPGSWLEWLREKAIPSAEGQLKGAGMISDSLSKVKAMNRWGNLLGGLERVADGIEATINGEEDSTPWVYDGYNDGKVIFKPVKVGTFGDEMIWRHGKKFLVMSATFLDPRRFAREVGVDPSRMKFVPVASSFPPPQRPIILRPVIENSHKCRDKAWRLIPEEAARICSEIQERTLIHTVSYGFSKAMTDILRRDLGPERVILTYSNAKERQRALEDFKQTPGAIVVAPSFDRGIDLAGDLCRLQIVAKIPYPYIGDKQVAARMHGGGGSIWYAMQAIRTLIQMTGRGMRKADDWCVTYILDGAISRLMRDHGRLFSEFWLEAVQSDGYEGVGVDEALRRWKWLRDGLVIGGDGMGHKNEVEDEK